MNDLLYIGSFGLSVAQSGFYVAAAILAMAAAAYLHRRP